MGGQRKSTPSRFTVFPGMKGGKLCKTVLHLVWVFVALLTIFQPSVALHHIALHHIPTLEERHALTDFADANAITQMVWGGVLHNWNISWDGQGNWTGGNPCSGFKGLVCWSTGDLMMVRLSHSGLQGPISPALGKFTSLNTLNLGENELSGDIGPILASLTWMKKLTLEGNNFTGSLANWVQNMRGLVELKLARNSFTGTIPTGVFTTLNNLTIVDVSNNSLSGPIPDDLVGLPSLQKLLLGGNNFNGALPESLSHSTLNTVDFSHNLLNGQLPIVWNTPNLSSLDLSGNNMSGPIPPQLLSLTSITQLNLAENNFVGDVSKVHSSKFGCDAFAGNPGLVINDPKCGTSLPARSQPSDSSSSPLAVGPFRKKKGLGTLTIVALTMGDVAFVFIAIVGFVLFFIWYKRATDSVKVGTSWPIAGLKEDDSSKDMTISSTGSMVTGPGPTSVPKSSFAPKPDVKPALKSVVGTIPNPVKDNRTRDQSLSSIDQSFSSIDFGTKIVILDTTLSLEFEELLRAKALVLGAGSFGVAYMACMEDGQMLAIKRIEELSAPDHSSFGKNCAQLAEVLHPNLLQLRAYCWSPQEKLLIFDYVKNGSVHSLLHERWRSSNQGNAIDWTTRLKIAVGTARALAHLHDSDMVHGNVKASNVLLDEQFEPRVSDFGLEMLLQRPLQLELMGANDGYLAPELVASATRRGTQDGDVYSLGVLLLELLTGRDPKGDNIEVLPTWVEEMASANRTLEIFDPALISMHVLPRDILEFLELAQACVSQDAVARPSVTIVLRTLESIVPGSTAPRSYVKDDNIDSDASYYACEGSNIPSSQEFLMPVKDDIEDEDSDDDDDSSF